MTDPISPLRAALECITRLKASDGLGPARAIAEAALAAPALPAEPPTGLSKRSAELIFETLQYYANVTTYQGERTGGVLKGCPRGPAPTPHELADEARRVLSKVESELRAAYLAAPGAAQTAEPPQPSCLRTRSGICQSAIDNGDAGCQTVCEMGAAQTVPSLLPLEQRIGECEAALACTIQPVVVAEMARALEAAEDWLRGWASAEHPLAVIQSALALYGAALRDPAGLAPGPSSAEPSSNP